jgi:hypothetical protein
VVLITNIETPIGHVLGSKSIAAKSSITEDDLEDLEKELEGLMMDDNIAGMFRSITAHNVT